ncbi:MAG: sugar ABC transporter ATP-binding protein, partial [Lachnospiraceae bacterium]|nr:sugar ABC transporter ATP-binding protein [Lachnospiraceae bacterium]
IIGTLDQSEYEPNRIRKMMVGRELKGDYYRSDYEGYSDEVVLKATDVTTLQDLLCLNLELHKGEILGIGGLSECGMHTVGKALFGIEKVLDGDVKLANGTVVKSPRVAIDNKMAYVSKNRDTESLGLSGTIAENIASTGYKINSFFLNLISFKKEKKYVDRQIEELQIKCAGKNYMVNTLSGGNKQKVVFGKWVASDAEVLILDCPTRGIDVGVKASMYKLFTEMKKAGKAILLISEELQELIGMCDRILIMKDGQVTREVMRAENPTESSLIDYMI